jgi:hypothetical protein
MRMDLHEAFEGSFQRIQKLWFVFEVFSQGVVYVNVNICITISSD